MKHHTDDEEFAYNPRYPDLVQQGITLAVMSQSHLAEHFPNELLWGDGPQEAQQHAIANFEDDKFSAIDYAADEEIRTVFLPSDLTSTSRGRGALETIARIPSISDVAITADADSSRSLSEVWVAWLRGLPRLRGITFGNFSEIVAFTSELEAFQRIKCLQSENRNSMSRNCPEYSEFPI